MATLSVLNGHGGFHIVKQPWWRASCYTVAVILIFLYSRGGADLVNSHGGANTVVAQSCGCSDPVK